MDQLKVPLILVINQSQMVNFILNINITKESQCFVNIIFIILVIKNSITIEYIKVIINNLVIDLVIVNYSFEVDIIIVDYNFEVSNY